MKDSYPSLYSILPAKVRYSKINPKAILFFAEIVAYTHAKGYCFASNKHFAKIHDVLPATITKWVTLLKKKGFIRVELIRENSVIIERRIYPLLDIYSKPIGVLPDDRGGTARESGGVLPENPSINNIKSNNNKPLNPLRKLSLSDEGNAQKIFFEFVKQYPGRKMGKLAAYDLFKSRCKSKSAKSHIGEDVDHIEEVNVLISGFQKELKWREKKLKSQEFVAEWKNLKTWINQFSWRDELPEAKNEISKHVNKSDEISRRAWERYKKP